MIELNKDNIQLKNNIIELFLFLEKLNYVPKIFLGTSLIFIIFLKIAINKDNKRCSYIK